MGIFGGGYDKPGKGVDKNEPKKKVFFLFFDIVIRKFTKHSERYAYCPKLYRRKYIKSQSI